MFTIFYEVPPYETATFKEAIFMIETFVEVMSKLVLVFFGQADNLLKSLVLFVVIDYITGICAAIQEKLLASGDNRHSGSGEKRQFWSTENSHLQFE